MYLSPFYECVLETARRDCLFSRADLSRVRSLGRNGLSLEQALVGTGLVPYAKYLAYLGMASALPVVADPSPVSGSLLSYRMQLELQCLLLEETEQSAHIGFTNADPLLLVRVREELPSAVSLIAYVIPYHAYVKYASILENEPVGKTAASFISQLFAEADARNVFQLRIVSKNGKLIAYADGTDMHIGAPSLPAAILPAFAVRLRRLGKATGWHIETISGGFEPMIHLTRVKGSLKHAVEFSEAVQRFFDRPSGALIFIGTDAYIARHVLAKLSAPEGREALGSGRIACLPADTSEEQEFAVHAALSGRPVIAVTSSQEDWWKPISQSGMNIHLVKSMAHSDGRTWSVMRARV